jgi:hypothetical protein
MTQAIFEAIWNAAEGMPELLKDENGNYIHDDGTPDCGWQVCFNVPEPPPPTMPIMIHCGEDAMAILQGYDAPLWLDNVNTPVQDDYGPLKDNPRVYPDQTPTWLFAGQAEGYVAWLQAAGWSAVTYADVFDALLEAYYRYEIGNNIMEGLHGVAYEEITCTMYDP